MVRARPIPRQLLIHTVEYEEYLNDDGWGDEFAEKVTIERVRMDVNEKVSRSQTSSGTKATNILFVDRTHSSPYPKFKKKSKIYWDGDEYEIDSVKALYDSDQVPHHYELGLV